MPSELRDAAVDAAFVFDGVPVAVSSPKAVTISRTKNSLFPNGMLGKL